MPHRGAEIIDYRCAYIRLRRRYSSSLNVGPNDPIDRLDHQVLGQLVVIDEENGEQPYDESFIAEVVADVLKLYFRYAGSDAGALCIAAGVHPSGACPLHILPVYSVAHCYAKCFCAPMVLPKSRTCD